MPAANDHESRTEPPDGKSSCVNGVCVAWYHVRAATEASAADASGRAQNVLANTAPFDVTGHPAASVPCGTGDGLPSV